MRICLLLPTANIAICVPVIQANEPIIEGLLAMLCTKIAQGSCGWFCFGAHMRISNSASISTSERSACSA
jgi:hypothetical protein